MAGSSTRTLSGPVKTRFRKQRKEKKERRETRQGKQITRDELAEHIEKTHTWLKQKEKEFVVDKLDAFRPIFLRKVNDAGLDLRQETPRTLRYPREAHRPQLPNLARLARRSTPSSATWLT